MEKIIIPASKMENHTLMRKMISYEVEVENANNVSDGYHTFGELYDHRITLFISLCKTLYNDPQYQIGQKADIWRSKRHSDGEICFGTGTQFLLGIGKEKGEQITYHIPIKRWNECEFAETLKKAPEWDGHTSEDVLKRLKNL
ncbi:MAG: hypothetical protein V3574_04375 [Candidatus Moraniibacteriota bacterium]